jgi:DNA-binding transcriptional MerR regulator
VTSQVQIDRARLFRVSEIVRLFGISRHFISWLVQTRIIVPFQDTKGRGRAKLFSYGNLLEIATFIHLNGLGWSHEAIRGILKAVSKEIEYRDGYGQVILYRYTDGQIEIGIGRMTDPLKSLDRLYPDPSMLSEIGTFDLIYSQKPPLEMEIGKTTIRQSGGDDVACFVAVDGNNIRAYLDSKIAGL